MASPEETGVALITGASSGIGEALARRLGAARPVGLVARRAERLDALAGEIRRRGGRAVPFPCDVGEREEVHRAVVECEGTLGPVDLLVANAGTSENTLPASLNAARVERILRVNFLGAVYCVEAVLPGMLERDRGRLVAVSSLAGYGGLPLTAAYSASKGAMTNFFESLRIDLRGSGVGVTVVSPGYVRTAMTEGSPHSKPFLIEVEDAAERIERAIGEGKGSVAFPWPLAAFAWLARIFPRSLYDRLAGGVDRRKEG
ncbi:MAG: SDR family NAD(P)-dependent oxidoreductase [Gemmatimonadetes bacterium]|nr:SDR family NAD(P)-dependent oxidoreductase [Gemmatimonadota bacterium]NIR80123.1 SDR family NAD(P)-dependent oxidoreductase [Gemmatimonadota bacterium]NIT88878.1 SDR family NAD(P)-dependent oxidoreductase [Gemmatimonadota bacterium]NIU32681.1 SDR family NAD(P)-dependent oxidoreductase [Gemmatimonadota bacterium]NIU37117.1 SDR family NAD(P)-dependent oxidoreductase [Gemmatimonadota bacterium]